MEPDTMDIAFSRTQTPPGGWIYYQPSTKWNAPNPIANTFSQQVVNIIKHRLANGAITVRHNLATDPVSVGNELEAFTRARLGLPAMGGASVPKPMPPAAVPSMSPGVVAAVAGIKKMAAGAALLLEWSESGLPPVSADVAEKRAAICVQCPKNDLGGMSKYFTAPVADNMRKRLAKLHEMNLKLSVDEKLGVCSACLCQLRLKSWTPAELILKRLKPEQRAELNQDSPRCWILDLV
jgi:hypothetical protein